MLNSTQPEVTSVEVIPSADGETISYIYHFGDSLNLSLKVELPYFIGIDDAGNETRYEEEFAFDPSWTTVSVDAPILAKVDSSEVGIKRFDLEAEGFGPFITASKVAKRCGVSTYTLKRWRGEGKGPAKWIKVSKTEVQYPRAEVERFLNNRYNLEKATNEK